MEETTLVTFLNAVRTLFGLSVPIFVSLALIYFVYGVLEYVGVAEKIISGADGKSEAKKSGKDKIIWGIVGMFIIVSVWGLVALIGNTFNIESGGSSGVEIPQF